MAVQPKAPTKGNVVRPTGKDAPSKKPVQPKAPTKGDAVRPTGKD
jgi:hypothetical protein